MKNLDSIHPDFDKYRETIATLDSFDNWREHLRITAGNNLEICYAPFDYVNTEAKVVLVGITPGETQAKNSLQAMRRGIDAGHSDEVTMRDAKSYASFSGPMRNNLISMLDHIGLAELLGIESCVSFFDENNTVAHFTSMLRYPVFKSGVNYNGTPRPLKDGVLLSQIELYFGAEIKQLPDALYIPLGDKVAEVLRHFVDQGQLESNQILDGLPHPSGANAERIAYFLGNKRAEDCSVKTNPAKIDAAKKLLLEKLGVDTFRAEHLEVLH